MPFSIWISDSAYMVYIWNWVVYIYIYIYIYSFRFIVYI